jgi:ATP-dependent RNA helicase DDX18/HAS1
VDCSGDDNEEKNPETAFSNKKSALLKIIEESPVRKTIIFCNKVVPSLISLCTDHRQTYKSQ